MKEGLEYSNQQSKCHLEVIPSRGEGFKYRDREGAIREDKSSYPIKEKELRPVETPTTGI